MASHHFNQDSDPDRFWQIVGLAVLGMFLVLIGFWP